MQISEARIVMAWRVIVALLLIGLNVQLWSMSGRPVDASCLIQKETDYTGDDSWKISC